MSTLTTDAIRKTVLVDFAPAEAFELFTARIASWWPVGTHSYGGDDVTDVVLEPRVGGRLYEVTDAGEQDWGRVLEWDPPSDFCSTGRSARRAEPRSRCASRRRARARASSSSIAASADPTRASATQAAGTSCSRPS